ncbi:MAG: Hsp20/alpha crystallin family protein [Halodesulfurarchaeum sp.]
MTRDDPFEDIFREIERLMEEMVGEPGPQDGGARMGVRTSTSTRADVYEDGDLVRVVADLPGVSRSDISVQCDGQTVTIGADTETRAYDERLTLPTRVDPESGSGSYNNGVLEVTFERTESSTDVEIE